MTLSAGTQLGPYEIVAPLGAGGMGEVYRAKDSRLGREVAIKVLPAALSSDAERLKRFEKEARSASALNHPNIVTVYDIGAQDGVSYLAMELVSGETLRTLIAGGPLPIKKILAIAPQIAEGLAKAHEAGIVHRDLKPENVMVTKDGLVKILDFGLAKLTSTMSGSDEGSNLPTMTGTTPGVVVGTVGYMSPEQASGQAVDFRSDQFSFGSILYEMATGKRAFQKKTAIDTLGAILNEEPEAIGQISPQTPAPLRWIVERCLAKEPRQRYSATDDLARDLADIRDHITEASGSVPSMTPARRSTPMRFVRVALALAVLLAAAYLVGARRSRPTPEPRFQKVTFQRGTIWRARFAPDGQTVVYSMRSIGDDLKPPELFMTRVGSLDARSLGLPPADILSISTSGQLAICLAPPEQPLLWGVGTLAEASLSGGTPRAILESVNSADWSPNGKELAVVRQTDKFRVEYPVGKVLYESPEGLAYSRISPDGRFVAFEDFAGKGAIRLADPRGAVRSLVEGIGQYGGIAWSPESDEIWWIKVPHHDLQGQLEASEVHAVDLKGHDRVVVTLPGDFAPHDLTRERRLLVERVNQTFEMVLGSPGKSDRSLTWLDQSIPVDLSADAQVVVFSDRGDAAGMEAGTYLRKTDGSPAVRLGAGTPLALSPDKKWVIASRGSVNFGLVLLPTGVGQEKVIKTGNVEFRGWAEFHPDGKRIFFGGTEEGHRVRGYELDTEGGTPRALTPEGAAPTLLSPDGAWLLIRDDKDEISVAPTEQGGGTFPRHVASLRAWDTPAHWSADGKSVLIWRAGTRPVQIDRLDLATGARTPWRSLPLGGSMGSGGLNGIAFSANEEEWVAGYSRSYSELVVIDGLK